MNFKVGMYSAVFSLFILQILSSCYTCYQVIYFISIDARGKKNCSVLRSMFIKLILFLTNVFLSKLFFYKECYYNRSRGKIFL